MYRSLGVGLLIGALSAGCQQCLAPLFGSEERLKISEPDRATLNFQSMSEIFPSRTISRRGPIHHFVRKLQPLGEIRYDFVGKSRTMSSYFVSDQKRPVQQSVQILIVFVQHARVALTKPFPGLLKMIVGDQR